MDTLPDALLGAILASVGMEAGYGMCLCPHPFPSCVWPSASTASPLPSLCRPSITLVCKRWHRVFHDQPRLWQTYCLAAPPSEVWEALPPDERQRWLAAKSRQLRRVAGVVTAAEFRCADELLWLQHHSRSAGAGSLLAALVGVLQPAALTSLRLNCCPAGQAAGVAEQVAQEAALDVLFPPAAEAALTRFPRLTSLAVHVGASKRTDDQRAFQLSPAAAEALRQLRQLHHLSLVWQGEATAALLHSVLRLPHLTLLRLAPASWSMPAGSLRQLSSLQRPQSLELGVRSGKGSLRSLGAPPAAAFPHLTSYQLDNGWRDCEVDALAFMRGVLACKIVCVHTGD